MCVCSVVLCVWYGMMSVTIVDMKEGEDETRCRQVHSLLMSKGTKGAASLNVPIPRTHHYQQWHMLSQHPVFSAAKFGISGFFVVHLVIRSCIPSLLLRRSATQIK